MKKPSATLPNNHELGSHRAAYYQIERQGKKIATFQNSTDAIVYADECSAELGIPYDVFIVNVFEHGTEATLYFHSEPLGSKKPEGFAGSARMTAGAQ